MRLGLMLAQFAAMPLAAPALAILTDAAIAGELARLLGGVEVTVSSTLGSAVTALGWQGQITDRADEASRTTRTMLTRLADCCQAAGTALLELAGAMSWHGPRLTELIAGDGGTTPRFGSPGGLIFGAEPRDPVIGLPVEPGTGTSTMARMGQPDAGGSLSVQPWRETLPVDDRERLIQQHVEDLEVHDQRCHDRLAHLRDDLESMFPHGITPQFLRSLLPSEETAPVLASMDVEESIRGNPIDGVVLLVGCDKTTPALLMGAASCDIPAIVVSGGPMLNGKHLGKDVVVYVPDRVVPAEYETRAPRSASAMPSR